MIRRLAIVAALALLTVPCWAKNIYVDPVNGNDTNAGTRAAPLLSLYQSQQLAVAGDVVHALPGLYYGANQDASCSLTDVSGAGYVCQNKSGSAGNPITFVSDVKWGAVLRCDHDLAFFYIDAGWNIIDGFDMSCPGTAGGAFGFGAGTYGTVGHNIYRNNYIHDMATSACPQTGALFSGDGGHDTFDSNVIRHIGSPTSGFPQCGVFHGVYTGSVGDIIVNNVISGVAGYAVHGYGGGVCNEVISNNTVFNNTAGGILLENTASGHPTDFCSNSFTTDFDTVTNNIAIYNGYGIDNTGAPFIATNMDGGITVRGDATGTHNIISNNIGFGNSPASAQVVAQSPSVALNSITSTTHMFKNWRQDANWAPDARYNVLNYQAKSGSGSPMIDNGTSAVVAGSALPTHDVLGMPRPWGRNYDIGAFEYQGPCCNRAFRP